MEEHKASDSVQNFSTSAQSLLQELVTCLHLLSELATVMLLGSSRNTLWHFAFFFSFLFKPAMYLYWAKIMKYNVERAGGCGEH